MRFRNNLLNDFGVKFQIMFTGKPQKNRAAAKTYFDEHLSHNDYYTQNETQTGQWIGIGAERLGLQPGGSGHP